MSGSKTNKSIVGYPYHTTDGVSWRHSQFPGVFAIPHSELTKNPATVLDFMQKARWPLAVEHALGANRDGLAVPVGHRRDARLDNRQRSFGKAIQCRQRSKTESVTRPGSLGV